MDRGILVLVAVGALGLIAVWLGIEVLVRRPARDLTAAAKRLASGDPSARSELDPSPGPLGPLTRAFDEMAAAVEARGTVQEQLGRDAEAKAEAQEARAALFSSITHDLRTPLTSIIAAATTLLGEGRVRPDDRRAMAETIRDEAERLDRLVGHVMTLSRSRAGVLLTEVTPTSIDELVEGVVSRLRRTLKGRRIRLDLPEDLPPVPIDVVEMEQALTNLVENAARHTPAGGEVAVAAALRNGLVELRVEDEGPGIPPADRERAMEPFVQLAGSDGGTGLGLAITRAVVEAHGGRFSIEDAPAGGAAMVISLPLGGPP